MKFLLLIALSASFSAQAVEWKSIFISGDDSIENFDNGRKTLSTMLAPLGAHVENQVHLTSADKEVKKGVKLATGENVVSAFQNLKITKKKDGCFVFMTSHGAKNQGFYLSRAGILTPANLAQLLDTACGDEPTVVLISACYSGQFINNTLAKKNRVIMTAAIADRPSFGCSADTKYTYWDECIIDSLPSVNTWEELYTDVKACISDKETRLGFQASKPQAFFGESMKGLNILNK